MDSSLVITQRMKSFNADVNNKAEIESSIFEIMKERKFQKLRRNKVLIKNTTVKTKDKYVILDVFKRENESLYYCCPICTDRKIVDCLSESFSSSELLVTCIHSDVCHILFGNDYNVERVEDGAKSIIEIIANETTCMVVVHPAPDLSKKAGVVVLTSRTNSPKCLTCSSRGKNHCIHIKIHSGKFMKSLNDSSSDSSSDSTEIDSHAGVEKVLRMKRTVNTTTTTKENDEDTLNPRVLSGADANVFEIKINFIPTKEEEEKNRKIRDSNQFFEDNILIPKGGDDRCDDHGRKYAEGRSILWKESINVVVHHTKEVDTKNIIVLFRPTVPDEKTGETCNCKKFYTGSDERLLRVTSATFDQSNMSRSKVIHFVSYEQLFKFLWKLLMGGEKLDAFIKADNFMNHVFFGAEKSRFHRNILAKAFKIFIHALQFPDFANFCFDCPHELNEGESEDDFDVYEYHVVDGIQMGCKTNDVKGHLPKEYFEEETDGDDLVCGVEMKDRTCLNKQKARNIVSQLLKDIQNKKKLKETICKLEEIRRSKNDENKMIELVIVLLKRLKISHQTLPEGYIKLFSELKIDTPISALLTAYTSNRKLYNSFYDYLKHKKKIFENPQLVEDFLNNFPVVLRIIQDILKHERGESGPETEFLPEDVCEILKEMIKIRIRFDKLSKSLAAQRNPPSEHFKPPIADVYPDYPIHTLDNKYKADVKKDPEEDVDCNKVFDSSSTISGGIGTLTCGHKITKGFRLIEKGESPQLFLHSILRRLPTKVKAKRRVVIYDFACKMHKCALRRFPYKIRRFQFVIDRHHQANHTACSDAYSMANYPFMNNMNSQLAEQLNNSLRKLSIMSAYSKFDTYIKIIEIFITVKNLTLKNII